MRHSLLPSPVLTLALGVGTTAAMRGLIATAGRSQRLLACLPRTIPRAVTVAAIAVAAHEHRGAAAGAQVASSGEFHWQSGPMDSGHKRALREILCRQRGPRQGASGRDIGSDLAVGAGVAPAFPPAGQLSTSSATAALPSPCRASLARQQLLRNSSAESPAGSKSQNRHIYACNSKPKITSGLRCSLRRKFVAAEFLRKSDTVNMSMKMAA